MQSERVQLTAYPPLGQITLVTDTHVLLTVLLEVPSSRSQDPWQVALWFSELAPDTPNEWVDLPLARVESSQAPSSLSLPLGHGTCQLFFSARLFVLGARQFTVKFRASPDQDWTWGRDVTGIGDATIIYRDGALTAMATSSLNDLIENLNPGLYVKTLPAPNASTQLWTLASIAQPAQGDRSCWTDIPLGKPWGNTARWLALVRQDYPWLAPRHGKSYFNLDKDAIFCAFLSPAGHHMLLLGLSGVDGRVTLFQSSASGEVIIRLRNDSVIERVFNILVAVGHDFDLCNQALMDQARHMSLTRENPSSQAELDMTTASHDLGPEWYEDWYDNLGFCTWNALGQQLTQDKVMSAVDALAHHGIKIGTLIIDDNWQALDYRGDNQFQHGWKAFEAEPKAFPNGLKSLVTQIKSKHKHIRNIVVWHALLGYWGGIAPDGELAHKYATQQVPREDADPQHLPLGSTMTVIAKSDVARFYDDFYRFLADSGINGVKTDAQSMTDTWVSASARMDLIKPYIDSWTIAALRHFGFRTISCMSQAPQTIFYSQLPPNRPAMLCRNSDDFYPDIPDSHPWHVWANAHNSLLTQHLNVLPDWDMFQTDHAYSGFHAAARCVSGGPIYITDVPRHHNLDIIKKMTALSPRGNTIILRPSAIGRSIDQYVDYNNKALLKVGCHHDAPGMAKHRTPILGIFNISAQSITEVIPLSRFPSVEASRKYVVRSFCTGTTTKPLDTTSPASQLVAALSVGRFDIFCAHPLVEIKVAHELRECVMVANLGLLEQFTGAAAIMSTEVEVQANRKIMLEARIKALGKLGIYISSLPALSISDDFMATLQGNALPMHTVRQCEHNACILEIDVTAAWEEMGLEAGWSNEVDIKVYWPLKEKSAE